MRTTFWVIVPVATLFLGGALQAATPEERCEAGKKREAGKYAACRLKAEARLSQGGEPGAYTTALQRCAAKLEHKFLKFEEAAKSQGAACPTTDDAEEVVAFVGSCSDVVTDGTATGGDLPVGCSASNCGNGTIEIGEACDLGNLNGGSCTSEGFEGGVLRCGVGCAYDTSECYAVRFEDNGDGTITDRQTRLMWEKKIGRNYEQELGNLQDADNTYAWSGTCAWGATLCQLGAGAESACHGAEGNGVGCSQCESQNDSDCSVIVGGETAWKWLDDMNHQEFGGYSDWRLPTKHELESIVDATQYQPAINSSFHGEACRATCVDVRSPSCSCTANGSYWSATHYKDHSTSAWYVSFASGASGDASKVGKRYVRAVRGGALLTPTSTPTVMPTPTETPSAMPTDSSGG